MARHRDPFGRALGSLRGGLRDGSFARGSPLVVVDLARRLQLSPTPVREALSRLAGEGLVVDRRGHGYFAPRYETNELMQLYQLHLNYVEFALRLQRRSADDGPRSRIWGRAALNALLATARNRGVALRDFVEAFFAEITSAAGNETLLKAHRLVADRLALPRRVEVDVFTDLQTELEALADLRDSYDLDNLGAAVGRYHAQRIKVSRQISDAIR